MHPNSFASIKWPLTFHKLFSLNSNWLLQNITYSKCKAMAIDYSSMVVTICWDCLLFVVLYLTLWKSQTEVSLSVYPHNRDTGLFLHLINESNLLNAWGLPTVMFRFLQIFTEIGRFSIRGSLQNLQWLNHLRDGNQLLGYSISGLTTIWFFFPKSMWENNGKNLQNQKEIINSSLISSLAICKVTATSHLSPLGFLCNKLIEQ